jgi:Type I restriction enzyme R protein N terminus (HSDR_N)
MESSSAKSDRDTIFDPIRKKWVERTPEEVIRQLLLRQMVEKLGYPRSLIAIEKELAQLPHLKLISSKQIPKRRADIIVFARGKEQGSLLPLMLVECKATPLTPKFAQQVIGYNAFVGAPFVTLANKRQVLTGRYDMAAGMYRFEQGLPPFDKLLQCCGQADRAIMLQHHLPTVDGSLL